MAVVITEILGTDPFSGSRNTINANFQALKTAFNTLEANLGISTSSGNIDVSAASGGQIKGKTFSGLTLQLINAVSSPTITMTGSTGSIVATSISLSSSATAAAGNFETLAVGGTGGSATFGGVTTFNDLAQFADGVVFGNMLDLGAVTAHTVLNSDNILVFDSSTTLALTATVGLVDGHTITLINKSASGTCTLNTTNILGFSTGSITFSGGTYKSCVTLRWVSSQSKWVITASSNMTIA